MVLIMSRILFILILTATLSNIANANNLHLGEKLPSVGITDKGELVLSNNTISYQTWYSSSLVNKARIIIAMAGRSSAKQINAKLITAISAAKFPNTDYQTTTIINKNDAVWGTGSFVISATKDSKKQYPWSSIVLDSNGVVQKTWGLKKENSAVIVINKNGQILFEKEGKLTQQEINNIIQLVRDNL